MKFKTVVTTLFIIGTQTLNTKAQTIPTPEFNNEILFVNADNTLSKLDKVDITYFTSPGIGMFTSTKMYIQASGCCASVTHSGKPTESFIIRVEPGVDPESIFTLAKFETKNNQRRILINKVNTKTALSGTNEVDLKKIPLSLKKLSEGIYLMTPQEQLSDGEYGFIKNRKGFDADYFSYCFSVKNNGH